MRADKLFDFRLKRRLRVHFRLLDSREMPDQKVPPGTSGAGQFRCSSTKYVPFSLPYGAHDAFGDIRFLVAHVRHFFAYDFLAERLRLRRCVIDEIFEKGSNRVWFALLANEAWLSQVHEILAGSSKSIASRAEGRHV